MILKIKTMLVQLSMFNNIFGESVMVKKMLTSAQKISKMINNFVHIKYLSESQFPPKISRQKVLVFNSYKNFVDFGEINFSAKWPKWGFQ